jgi:hypothetical protein
MKICDCGLFSLLASNTSTVSTLPRQSIEFDRPPTIVLVTEDNGFTGFGSMLNLKITKYAFNFPGLSSGTH